MFLQVLSGYVSRGYEVIETACAPLSNLFRYFRAMRTCHANLQYFDWDGQVHLTGKTGGQLGDPYEC